jgi:hypothetical protein
MEKSSGGDKVEEGGSFHITLYSCELWNWVLLFLVAVD